MLLNFSLAYIIVSFPITQTFPPYIQYVHGNIYVAHEVSFCGF